MTSQSDVVARMIATLAITEPNLDTSIGSVTRKILDAVGESVAESYIDQHLLAYQYDIDSKIEADLDDFCALFGIGRLAPKRATGVVTFSRGVGDSTRNVAIQVNTQIASNTDPSILVSTVTPSVIPAGAHSVDVPVQAVVGGPSGNVGAGSLVYLRDPLPGVMAVTNINPLSGGTTAETDSELRARWKRTVFRSLAGTQSMFEGIALHDPDCSMVNVIGATKEHREQVQIIDGVGVSSIDDVEYIYSESVVLGPAIDESMVFLPGHDYTFDTTVRPPKVVMKTGLTYPTGEYNSENEAITAPVEGTLLDLVFEYAPRDSRNLPAEGITNRVDLWCGGERAEAAIQTVIFQNNRQFGRDVASPYFFRKFIRPTGDPPLPGSLFIPLAFGPILSLPATIRAGGQTYQQGVHYFLVHDDGPFGYTPKSLFGLEWISTYIDKPLPPANTVMQVGGAVEDDESGSGEGLVQAYTFNAVPRDIQSNIDRWRLVGIDAKVHQAKMQRLRFNLAVMYSPRAVPDVVNTLISTALASFVANLGFNATVQVSDAIQAVHNVAGVDNVRFLEGGDWPTYNPDSPNGFGVGIQRVVNGVVRQSYVDPQTGRAKDVTFGDSELPVFESVRGDRFNSVSVIPAGIPSVRAQNTFYPQYTQ